MGILKKVSCWIATLGPLGYLPAPGTWGTLCAVPVMYALHSSLDRQWVDIIFVFGIFIAMYVIEHALPSFREKDPSHIVIDEFLGFTLLTCLVPVGPVTYMASFLLFRFFDIVKPLGIKGAESYEGAFGIILDDIYAAIYASIGVWGSILFFEHIA